MYLTDGVMNMKRNSLDSLSIRVVVCDYCGTEHKPTSMDFITVRGDILRGLTDHIFVQTVDRNRRVTSETHYCKTCLPFCFPGELVDKALQVLGSVNDMIILLDERGRSVEGNSRMLWQGEWDELRTALYDSSNVLMSITHPHEFNDAEESRKKLEASTEGSN